MLHHPKPHLFDLRLMVNGELVERQVTTHLRLLDFIRDDLGFTGSKEVCGEGECGACTVILDGQSVNACLILAVEAHDREIVTIEGLSNMPESGPIRDAFENYHAVQCGYCIPGMVITGKGLLKRNPQPSREEIKHELSGNICRCTGYHKIVDAIEHAQPKKDNES